MDTCKSTEYVHSIGIDMYALVRKSYLHIYVVNMMAVF